MKNKMYRISEEALFDLENIWLYTYNTCSLEQADRYYKLIIDEIKFVAENFKSGKSMEHIRKGYRASKVKSHIIFYRKSNDNNIEIIRILHQMMDVNNRLSD